MISLSPSLSRKRHRIFLAFSGIVLVDFARRACPLTYGALTNV